MLPGNQFHILFLDDRRQSSWNDSFHTVSWQVNTLITDAVCGIGTYREVVLEHYSGKSRWSLK